MLLSDTFYFIHICKITASFLHKKSSSLKTWLIFTFVKFSSVFSKWPFKGKDAWKLLSIRLSFLPEGLWVWSWAQAETERSGDECLFSAWLGEPLIPEQQEEIPLALAPLREPQLTFVGFVVSFFARWLAFSHQLCVDASSLFWFPKWVPPLQKLCQASCSTVPTWDELTVSPCLTSVRVMLSPVGFLNH